MTYDDGILQVCEQVKVSENTVKPVTKLKDRCRFYFSYGVVGVERYYTALRANVQIDAVVNIPGWEKIDSRDVVVLEDGTQFRISQIQPMKDTDGLRMTKISITRITENYEFLED